MCVYIYIYIDRGRPIEAALEEHGAHLLDDALLPLAGRPARP